MNFVTTCTLKSWKLSGVNSGAHFRDIRPNRVSTALHQASHHRSSLNDSVRNFAGFDSLGTI
jgi:hypothetical protein